MGFPSATGPRLAGLLDLPEGRVRGWGVFAHGFALSKDSPAAARICKQLAAKGIGMLRFDNLGLGHSEGNWGDGSFTTKVAEPSHVEHNYDALVERIMAEGEAEWLVGGRALTIKRAFVEDIRAAELRQRIRNLRLPLLVRHSPTDNTVGIANASEIFRAARDPRSFVSLEGSDHLLTAPGQARRAARIISAWADQYLTS